ncbi:MAG: right-handed parallel beta-helix repeat-containing protein [Puniceicoccaceae bacterium]
MSRTRNSFALEVLEPRLLLSADPMVNAVPSHEESIIGDTTAVALVEFQQSPTTSSEGENSPQEESGIFEVSDAPLAPEVESVEAADNAAPKQANLSLATVEGVSSDLSLEATQSTVTYNPADNLLLTLKAGQGPPGEAVANTNNPIATVPRPVLVVPGIAGTFAAPGAEETWYTERGISPDFLEIDPLAGFYDDILATFENAAGYKLGETLFAATYDWRMAPGPAPENGEYDGIVSGLTAASLTDDVYEFSVDYLGYWMERAVNKWTALYGEAPDGVDLVTHSTGGLVARTYIQSDAYGQSNGSIDLPIVQNLVMVGVPNRGAPKAWNPLQNDFSGDVSFQIVLSKVMLKAYELYQDGAVITGADGEISQAETPGLTPEAFINLYVPTIRGLLSTYDFLYTEGADTPIDANATEFVNEWILDLNNGLDEAFTLDEFAASDPDARNPNLFAVGDLIAQKIIVVYSTGEFTLPQTFSGEAPDPLETITTVRTFTGIQDPGDLVTNFDEFYGHQPEQGETWHRWLTTPVSGDGTVPTQSSYDQFDRDPNRERFTFLHITEPLLDADNAIIAESIGHTGLMANRQFQIGLLDNLDLLSGYDPTKISTTLANPIYETLFKVIGLQILDPIELFEQADWTEITEFAINQGIRLGLNEVSQWLGNIDKLVVEDAEDAGFITSEINPLMWPVPLTDRSIGELLSLRTFFNDFIAFPLIDYMENTPGGGTEGLVNEIKKLGDQIPDTITDGATYTFEILGNVAKGGILLLQDPRVQELLALDAEDVDQLNEAVFYVPFKYSRTSLAPLNLGAFAALQGYQIEQGAGIEFTATMEGTIVFGYDMREGVADEDRFFIRFNELDVGAQAAATNLNLSMNVGVLEAAINNGSVSGEAGIRFGFNPTARSERGNITQSQLAANSGKWDGFMSLNPASGPYGDLDVNLPLTVSYPGLTDVLAPVLTITGNDFFNKAPEVGTSGFGNLIDFSYLSPANFEDALLGMTELLDSMGSTPAMQENLPFAADLPLYSVLDLGNVLNTSIVDSLRTEDGVLTYSNLQDFINLADSTTSTSSNSGITAFGIQPLNTHSVGGTYDQANHSLTFSFEYGFQSDFQDQEFSFDYDLEPLEIFISGGAFSIDTTGVLGFDLVLDLSPPVASVKASEALPADGVLAEAAAVEVLLNGGIITNGETVVLNVDPDPTNQTAADLVADVNEAIAATYLNGVIHARLDGGNLVIETIVTGPDLSLYIFEGEGLGFAPADVATVQAVDFTQAANISVDFSAQLFASHFAAGARIGYAGVFINNGSASLDLGFSLELTPGGPVRIGDALIDLFLDPQAFSPVVGLTASGSILLEEISVDAGSGVGSPAPGASIEISLAAGAVFPLSPTDPSQFEITFNGDFSEVLKLESLDYETMVQLLRDGLGVLEDIVQFDFLNAEIPFLGGSVNDVLSLVDVFLMIIADLEASAPPTIQAFVVQLNGLLQDLLDAAFPGQGLQASVSLEFGNDDILRLDFSYLAGTTVSRRFELDPGDAIPGLQKIVDIEGSSMLEISIMAWIQFAMGIDLSNSTSPALLLFDGTDAVFELFLAAEALNFTAAAPLGFCIKNGSVYIDDGTPEQGPARAQLAFTPSGTDRMVASTVTLGDFSTSVIGEARATLPVCFPIGGDTVGDITFGLDFTDLLNPSFDGPDFVSLFSGADLLDMLGDGLDLLLRSFNDIATGDILGFEIPFFGDQLKEVVSFIIDLQAALEAAFDAAVDLTTDSIDDLLFSVVGPGGLNFLLPSGTLGLPDIGTSSGGLGDIDVQVTEIDGAIDDIRISLQLGQFIEVLSKAIDFDDGLPGLELNLDVGLVVELAWKWNLVFGVNRSSGFYFDPDIVDELQIHVNATLPDTDIGGSLGFLTLRVYEGTQNPNDTGLSLAIVVDLLNPGSTSGGLLTLGNLLGSSPGNSFDVRLNGNALMDLILVAGFAGGSGEVFDALPTFEVDFLLDWDFVDASTSGGVIGNLPNIQFSDIRLDVGTFFADFLRPIILQIEAYLEPLRDILNWLDADIEALNWRYLGRYLDQNKDGDVTLLDLAALFGLFDQRSIDFLNTLATIDGLLGAFSIGAFPDRGDGTPGSGIKISLGGYDFGGSDLRTGSFNFDPVNGFRLPDISIDDAFAGLGGNAGDYYSETQVSYSLGEGKFNFELFNPENLINLLMGNPVEFFTYKMPEFSFSFVEKYSVPIWRFPSIDVGVSFFAFFRSQLSFGYDSSGVDLFQSSGEVNDLFGGFYIEVGELVPPQLLLSGGIGGFASISLEDPIFDIGVEAGLELKVELVASFNLVDPGNGKLYFWQIADLVEERGLLKAIDCIYTIDGGIYAELSFYIDYEIDTWRKTLLRAALVEFGGESENCFSPLIGDRLETPVEGFQSNNTVLFAADIGVAPGIHLRGASISRPGDIDVYKFELLDADSIEIKLFGTPEDPASARNMELSLLNGNGQLMAMTSVGSNTKTVRGPNVLPAGTYFVRIASTDRTQGAYSLDIDPATSSSTRVFYVNGPYFEDQELPHAFYSLAGGNDSHPQAGLSPEHPALTLDRVLQYGLTPDDLVLFDTGTYTEAIQLTGDHAGFTFAGAPSTPYREFDESFNFGSTLEGAPSGTRLSVDGADNLTVAKFVFSENQTGLAISNTTAFRGVDLNFRSNGTAMVVSASPDMTLDGVSVAGGVDRAQGSGLVINQSGNFKLTNATFSLVESGISLSNVNTALIENVNSTRADTFITAEDGLDLTLRNALLEGGELETFLGRTYYTAVRSNTAIDIDNYTIVAINNVDANRYLTGALVRNASNVSIQSFDTTDVGTGFRGYSLSTMTIESSDLRGTENGLRIQGPSIIPAPSTNITLQGVVVGPLTTGPFDSMDYGADAYISEVTDLEILSSTFYQGALKVVGSTDITMANSQVIEGTTEFINNTTLNISNSSFTAMEGSNAFLLGVRDSDGTNSITGIVMEGPGKGLNIEQSQNFAITGSTFEDMETAIRIAGDSTTQSSGITIEGNTFSRGEDGIVVANAQVSGIAITDNTLSDFGGVGIDVQGSAELRDNRVQRSNIGIRFDSGTPGMWGNSVWDSIVGIFGSGYLGNDDYTASSFNRVYNNGTGIYAQDGAVVAFNKVHNNDAGIVVLGDVDVHHNLVYDSVNVDVQLGLSDGAALWNNTIHSTGTAALQLTLVTTNTDLRNNIVWSEGGTTLFIDATSGDGLTSDYNNFYVSGGGVLIDWKKTIDDLYDWQVETGQDLHSIGTTQLEPMQDKPNFVAGDSNRHVEDLVSTTINAGDPSFAFDNEPGPSGGPNGLRINQGVYGNTTQAALSPASYIRVLSPNYYTDYTLADARRISWESFNVTGNVVVELFRDGVGKLEDLATVDVENLPPQVLEQPDSEGSIIWSPQSSGLTGNIDDRYFINVVSSDDSNLVDRSREVFSVPADSTEFFVNNDSQDGDLLTSAIGNNRNTGTSAGDPKAIVFGILDNYSLSSGDTVSVDTGAYIHLRDVLISSAAENGNNEAFVLTGPSDTTDQVIFDRASTRAETHSILLDDASFVTISNLTLENGNVGVEATNGSTFLTVDNVEIREHAGTQIFIHSGSDRATLNDLYIHHGESHGIVVDAVLEIISNTSVQFNAGWGIRLNDSGNGKVENSAISGNSGGGIFVDNDVTDTVTTIGFEDLSQDRGNIISDNGGNQVDSRSNAAVIGNAIFHSFGSALEGTGTGIHMLEGEARYNVIYGHASGIVSTYEFNSGNSVGSLIEYNRIFKNTVEGIRLNTSFGDVVTGNVIYSTPTGIYMSNSSSFAGATTFTNNLIYKTEDIGIYLNRADGFAFTNNTIYALSGDALVARYSPNGDIRNNIFYVNSGPAIDLDVPSEEGISSDYNIFQLTDFGTIGLWAGGSRGNLTEWQNVSFLDQNSLETDPLFVDPDGDDDMLGYGNLVQDGRDDNFHLQSTEGSIRNGSLAPVQDLGTGRVRWEVSGTEVDAALSPGIDRGDSSFAFDQEPSPNGNFINIGAFGNTELASLSPASYVLVTSPAGGETWPIGQTFDIQWRSHDFTGTVDIVLKKSGGLGTIATIASGTENDGLFEWLVPDTLTPGSSYIVEVIRKDFGAASGQSAESFSISEAISFYYVNDDIVDPNTYTTATGDNAKDGLSPGKPKASIRAILDTYDLGPGDVILVDPGTYNITTNILIEAADSGVTIRGFTDPARTDLVTVIDRGGYTLTSFIFEITGATDVTIEHIQFRNAQRGVFADTDNATNLTLRYNYFYLIQEGGIYLNTGNAGLLVEGNDFEGSGGGYNTGQMQYGVYYRGSDATIRGNNFLNSSQTAIEVNSAAHSEGTQYLIEKNNIDGARRGIGFTGSNNDANALIRENTVINSVSSGIRIGGTGVVATENIVFDNQYGIEIWYGALATGNLEVYNNDVGIFFTGPGTASDNTVYNNTIEGIRSTTNNTYIEGNTSYNNPIGIRFTVKSSLVGNVVHSNDKGLLAEGLNSRLASWHGLIANNLVYGNTEFALRIYGISTSGNNSAEIFNNTFVQAGIDTPAVILDNAPGLDFRNNIVSVNGGIAMDVSDDSQSGFQADYNLYSLRNTSGAFLWAGAPLNNHADWFYNVGADGHSQFTDPRFVNVVTGDYHLAPDSPGIDAGDPASEFVKEPNPSGFRINVGAYGNTPEATQSASRAIQIFNPTGLDKLVQSSPTSIEFFAAGFLSEINMGQWNLGRLTIDDWQLLTSVSGGNYDLNGSFGSADTSGLVDPAPADVYEETWQSSWGLDQRIDIALSLLPGEYRLRLHFGSFESSAGQTFDVIANGNTVLSDYDIFVEAGGRYKASIEEVTVTVGADGALDLALVTTSQGYATISAIEAILLNPDGLASPTFNMEVSFDSGNSFSNVTGGLTLDRSGKGSYDWTPFASTDGPTAMIRISSEDFSNAEAESPLFLIANSGNRYYVNDDSLDNDVFRTAVGNNANSGKDPGSPMRNLEALLTVYSPGQGDTIFVDSGTYTLSRNLVVTAEQSGVTIVGAFDSENPNAKTILDRNNRNIGSYGFELAGVTDLTLEHLTITNAYRGLYGPTDGSSNLTVRNSAFINNQNAGIYLETGNPGVLVERSHFQGSGVPNQGNQTDGIYLATIDGTILKNTFKDNSSKAINIFHNQYNTETGYLISGNEVEGSTDGISVNGQSKNATLIDNKITDLTGTGIAVSPDGALIEDNKVTGGSTGIISYGDSILFDNKVSNATTGISASRGLVTDNEVFSNTTGLSTAFGSGIYRDNTVYDNDTGILLSPNSEVIGNRIYSNGIGLLLQEGTTVAGSVSYVLNNVVYGNTIHALMASGRTSNLNQLVIRNNTFVHNGEATAAILLTDYPNIDFRNNILSISDGTGMDINNGSQSGYTADYNLYWVGGSATAIIWGDVEINDQADLVYGMGAGRHSIFADPQFLAAFINNYHLKSTSPAIDAGDPDVSIVRETEPVTSRTNIGAYGDTLEATSGSIPSIGIIDPVSLDKLLLNGSSTIRFSTTGFLREQGIVKYNSGNIEVEDWLRESTGEGTIRKINPSYTIDLSTTTNPAPVEVYEESLMTNLGSGNRLDITLNLQPGEYELRLHFIQYQNYNNFSFDIRVDDSIVRSGYNISARAGGYNRGLTEIIPVTVGPDGQVLLSLVSRINYASISGLEVLKVNPDGFEDPRFDVEVSYNDGASYIPVARFVPVDDRGIGQVDWSPAASTDGRKALVRVVSLNEQEVSATTEPFAVANDGNRYYVNDDSTDFDIHTSGTGDNSHTGKTPERPMASLEALLSAYTFSPGDIIFIDSGTYHLSRDILLSAEHSGIQIIGAYDPGETRTKTILNRSNSSAQADVFEINGATDITIQDLTITGAGTGINVVADSSASNLHLVNLDIQYNAKFGILVGQGNGRITIDSSRFTGTGLIGQADSQEMGISLTAADLVIRNSVFTDHYYYGIVDRTRDAIFVSVEDSSFSNSRVDIIDGDTTISRSEFSNSPGRAALVLSGANSMVHDSVFSGSGLIHSGTLFIGALNVLNGASAVRNVSFGNQVGIRVINDAIATDNIVFDNDIGVFVENALVEGNRVFGNVDVGIYGREEALIFGNKVYSNGIGIQGYGSNAYSTRSYFEGTITNNIVFDNGSAGIQIDYTNNNSRSPVSVINNTVHQPTGNAILIRNMFYGTVANNILSVEAGFGINIDAFSLNDNVTVDFNLFYLQSNPNAQVGDVDGTSADTVEAWRSLTGKGDNSLVGDPRFFDINGADDLGGYSDVGGILVDGGVDDNFHLLAFSDAIDRANLLIGPVLDAEGDVRRDDPGIDNQGGLSYDIEILQSSLHEPSRGIAQGWRSTSGKWTLALPFEFTYFGETYTQIEVTSSGQIGFPTIPFASTTGSGETFSRETMLAPFWGNIDTSFSGRDIFVDASVDGELYIRWEARNRSNSTWVRFAVLLQQEGAIRFDYGEGNISSAASAPWIGLSPGNNWNYLLVDGYHRSENLANANSVLMTPAPSFADIGAYEFKGDSNDIEAPLTLSTIPAEIEAGGSLVAFLDSILIQLSESIDTIDAASPATFELLRDSNGDSTFNDLDTRYTLTPVLDSSTNTIELRVEEGFLPEGDYQFVIKASNLRDVTGNPLDGSGTGTPGSDYLRQFTLIRPVLSEVTSNSSATAVRGEPFQFQVTATEAPTGFAATGLPTGFSINPQSGLITGTPAETGEFEITLSVTNSDGVNTSPFTLVVKSAPQVTGTTINGGDAQRSFVTRIEIFLDTAITSGLESGDVQLLDIGTGNPVDPAEVLITWSFVSQSIVLTFPALPGESIPEGNYQIRIASASISVDGLFLDGDGDGTQGGDYVLNFHRLPGDSSGNRAVDTLDALLFRRSYESSLGDNAYRVDLDFNQDGTIDSMDGQVFLANLYTSLPAGEVSSANTSFIDSFSSEDDYASRTNRWLSPDALFLTPRDHSTILSDPAGLYDLLRDDDEPPRLTSLYL